MKVSNSSVIQMLVWELSATDAIYSHQYAGSPAQLMYYQSNIPGEWLLLYEVAKLNVQAYHLSTHLSDMALMSHIHTIGVYKCNTLNHCINYGNILVIGISKAIIENNFTNSHNELMSLFNNLDKLWLFKVSMEFFNFLNHLL